MFKCLIKFTVFNCYCCLHSPNGFYRAFTGNDKDPGLLFKFEDQLNRKTHQPTGHAVLRIKHAISSGTYRVTIRDNAYGQKAIVKGIAPGTQETILLPLDKSYGWYDFSVKVGGFDIFEKRYAGHAENGRESFSDPLMGRMIS